jgi:protocatechuate 3,4-dioxygenase, alpha subunit
MSLTPTAGQTVGPFFGYALPFPHDSELVEPGTPGAITLRGVVYDGAGSAVPDAILELWQADPDGTVVRQPGSLRRGRGPSAFTGFGRASTDDEGRYSFTTVTPGASFFALTVFARGLLNRLFTRAYLPDASDEFLEQLDPDRRSTLVATRDDTGLVFDIHLQGDRETVFLTYPRHEG